MPSGKHKHGYGQNKERCARYRSEHRQERNKLRRIIRCNGLAAAEAWAERFGATAILKHLLKGRSA